MASISYAVLAVLPVIAYLLYVQLYRWRFQKYKGQLAVAPEV